MYVVDASTPGACSSFRPGPGCGRWPRKAGSRAGWEALGVMRSVASLLTAAGLFIMLAVLFACTYVGRDDALSQRFTRFSYVNGDDIRAQFSAPCR